MSKNPATMYSFPTYLSAEDVDRLRAAYPELSVQQRSSTPPPQVQPPAPSSYVPPSHSAFIVQPTPVSRSADLNAMVQEVSLQNNLPLSSAAGQPPLVHGGAPQYYDPSLQRQQLPMFQNAWSHEQHALPTSEAMYGAYPGTLPFPNHSYISASTDSSAAPSAGGRSTFPASFNPSAGVFYRTPQHPRLRTAQACEKCRTRKAKCSGEHPSCRRCLNRGLVCEYASEGRTRGPNKPKNKDSSSPTRSSARKPSADQGPLGSSSSQKSTAPSSGNSQASASAQERDITGIQDARPPTDMHSFGQRRLDRPRPPPLRLDVHLPARTLQSAGPPFQDAAFRPPQTIHPAITIDRPSSTTPKQQSYSSFFASSPSHGLLHRSSVHGLSEVSSIMALNNPYYSSDCRNVGYDAAAPNPVGSNLTLADLLRSYNVRTRTDSLNTDASMEVSPFSRPMSLSSDRLSPLPPFNSAADHSESAASSSPSPILTPCIGGERDIMYNQDALPPAALEPVSNTLEGSAWLSTHDLFTDGINPFTPGITDQKAEWENGHIHFTVDNSMQMD